MGISPGIFKVERDKIISTLPHVKRHIEGVLDMAGGHYDIWDIAAGVDAGVMDLFVAVSGNKIIGCGLLMEQVYPRMKTALVMITAGDDFADWRDEWIEVCRLWAKNHGCKQVEMIGRKGWMRNLRGIADVLSAHMVMEV